MKNDRIVSAYEKIHIDDETSQRILNAVLEENKKNGAKEPHRAEYGVMLRAAAFVCAFIALCVFAVNDMFKETFSQNSFSITANAAEITTGTRVNIGEFLITSQSMELTLKDDPDESGIKNRSIYSYDISRCVEFPVICEGDCIKNITYSIQNGNVVFTEEQKHFNAEEENAHLLCFILHPDYEKKTINDGIPNKYLDAGFFYVTDSTITTEYTVAYENQPGEEEFGAGKVLSMNQNNVLSDRSKIVPVMLEYSHSVKLNEEEKNEISTLFKEKDFAYVKYLTELDIEKNNPTIYLDVTAEYNDGTFETKTMLITFEIVSMTDEEITIRALGELAPNN